MTAILGAVEALLPRLRALSDPKREPGCFLLVSPRQHQVQVSPQAHSSQLSEQALKALNLLQDMWWVMCCGSPLPSSAQGSFSLLFYPWGQNTAETIEGISFIRSWLGWEPHSPHS